MLTGCSPGEGERVTSVTEIDVMTAVTRFAAVAAEHSYDLGEMYGENYGYRSGSMQAWSSTCTIK